MSAEAWFLDTAIGTGVYGLLAGMLVPSLIGRVPEPEPDAPPPADEAGAAEAEAAEVEEPKPLYADIARSRGLRWKTALATALVAALVGGRVGWQPELSLLLYLAPVGVALAVID